MTPERWRQITDVFHAALSRATPARQAFLDEACAGDQVLRVEVDTMLSAHAGAGQFGDTPVVDGSEEMPGLESGSEVGPYHIDTLIGAGGMGQVYRARDPRIGRDVAIKVLPAAYAADADRLKRFEQEARASGALNHPNVLTLYDVGTSDGRPYMVMELLNGETLRDRVARGPMSSPRASEVAAAIAHGLAAAHAKGIVHRDLKPENVMVTRDGRVKILDFGIAKLRVAERGPDERTVSTPLHTAPDTMVGTAGYMAPEQIRGLHTDERADLFALGAILFELLTGGRAFDRGSRVETLNAILHDDSPALSNAAVHVPPALDRIVQRCLEKDPDARFQSARDLAFALETVAGSAMPIATAVPDGPRARVPRAIGVRRAALLALGVAMLAALAVWAFGRSATGLPASVLPHQSVVVLVTDMENRTADPVFDLSMGQALSMVLEDSSFITAYPRLKVREAARALAVAEPFTLDEALARLIAVREGITVVVAGSVEKAQPGYTISVRLVEVAGGKTLKTATTSALTKKDALQSLASLATTIREALGDAPSPGRQRVESWNRVSLEAMHTYAVAVGAQSQGDFKTALAYFKRATEQEPSFAEAYFGWYACAWNLEDTEEATKAKEPLLGARDYMSQRAKFRMLGKFHLGERDYQRAVESYHALLKQYPDDVGAWNDLSIALQGSGDLSAALDAQRRAVELTPRASLYRTNYALMAMYTGDFELAVTEANLVIRQSPENNVYAYLPLAIAALARGDSPGAREAYARLAKVGASGLAASYAALGLADLAMYEGRNEDAERIAAERLVEDPKDSTSPSLYMVLAEAYEGKGDARLAIEAAQKALTLAHEGIAVPAARILARLGNESTALALIHDIKPRGGVESRAYGKILEGEIAHKQGNLRVALSAFREARSTKDLWLTRFDSGVTQVELGEFSAALSELEICLGRRGEATSILFDDMPSFRYLAPLSYWLGRAQEGSGLKSAAIESYKKYLAVRIGSTKDTFAEDARQRLVRLQL